MRAHVQMAAFALVGATAIAAQPAAAACILDLEKVKQVASIFAASRACPQFTAIKIEDAAETLIAIGAVSATDGRASWCRADYSWRIEREWLQWSEYKPKLLANACAEMDGNLRSTPAMLKFIIAIGMVKG